MTHNFHRLTATSKSQRYAGKITALQNFCAARLVARERSSLPYQRGGIVDAPSLLKEPFLWVWVCEGRERG